MDRFDFMITGIGSVPFLDVEESCLLIKENFPDMPFWPQLVKRSPYEDMIIQFSEGIPFLKVSEEKRAVFAIKGSSPEKELTRFYEMFFSEQLSELSISIKYAPGLYKMVELVKDSDASFIKGQIVGPITFAASIKDDQGKAIIGDNELMDVCVKGIAMKGLWQVRKLKEAGKRVVLFLDEPYLASIGSAFSTISKDNVIEVLKEVINYIREREDVLLGIHCCANTDWSMIISACPDIISFDAFGYMDHFLLYRDEILRFLKNGGNIAWGIVPTTDSDFEKKGDANSLFKILKKGIENIVKWGMPLKEVAEHSLLTPSCGMGTMKVENAKRVISTLAEIFNKSLVLVK